MDALVITTKHNTHSKLVLKSIKNKKHIFVEKPLAITLKDIHNIEKKINSTSVSLTVGFNRRFAPFSIKVKSLLSKSIPKNIVININSGYVDRNHWVHDIKVGGGRVIGEVCHFIDLITYFNDSLVQSVIMNSMGPDFSNNSDNVSILLKYVNGSQGVINYFSNGNKSYSKERIEIYENGKNIIIDNFMKLYFYGYNESNKSIRQDKGHYSLYKSWYEMLLNGGKNIIPIQEILNTSKASILCVESLKKNSWVHVK